MKGFKYYFSTLMLLGSITYLSAENFNVSDTKLNEIETRIKSMSYKDLISTRSELIEEQALLVDRQANTQNPSENKRIQGRINEIVAELLEEYKSLSLDQVNNKIFAIINDELYSNLRNDLRIGVN